ncbi:hypothetical protein H6G20_08225 [Desertifilum sp. FACHB-1129]|uniref:EcsC family protein n=1 Tax=Desertifilum tharense IPPAS B-1220 TaxID=1781255 RepID=A0A1E5QNZ9_9CYAN|nr:MULTISPECIES: hypothetical protein [Desertifilum]MDA0209370.1 hypothetical protein [Cyanobacteria bacterium FC1]MBD2311644.1 hypothetical protein [Desertifilum sp. FACHB-1129]MBD2322831.1 hypothetical protein [Desertifilum sp. FACHB-866]MBD2332775.1 hypothetical protein [Desertifilum sp. FACHB-868]OEJ76334.1 hypothetical protein BH720_04820 [Desertifilum tharense IPPAS B-1220]
MAIPTASSCTDKMNAAIADAIEFGISATKDASDTARGVAQNVGTTTHQFVEQGTETIGRVVTPIAENPVVKYATKLPVLSWVMAALGQVDIDKVEQDIEALRQKYPSESPSQISHRIIVDTALQGGRIGLLTNFIPPLALALFAVDLAAVTALQAEMIYRIAAAYGFSLHEPTRRGEVLAIYGLSVGSSGVVKTGLSFIELIPLVGTVAGAANNATLLYALGVVATQFYEAKKNAPAKEGETVPFPKSINIS